MNLMSLIFGKCRIGSGEVISLKVMLSSGVPLSRPVVALKSIQSGRPDAERVNCSLQQPEILKTDCEPNRNDPPTRIGESLGGTAITSGSEEKVSPKWTVETEVSSTVTDIFVSVVLLFRIKRNQINSVGYFDWRIYHCHPRR